MAAFYAFFFYSMALQIKSLKQLSIVSSLVMDFVSESCFELPKERNCTNRTRLEPNLGQMLNRLCMFYEITEFSCIKGYWGKFLMFYCLFFSCSQGFTKASDLLEALKKIEEKDTVGVRKSGYGRKRGIPVRLYKRCLRLEREADVIAQLT